MSTLESDNGGMITSVEKQQKNEQRYNIYVDGRYEFSVHENTLVKFRLFKGERVDKNSITAIAQAEEEQSAYLDAIRSIARKPRTVHEINQMLQQKGYEPSVIDQVIHKLNEQQYVDDRKFAQIWTEHRIHSQRRGKKWIQMELREKGVSKEMIEEALADLDEDAEYESGLELASKKWLQDKTTPSLKRKQKVMAMLLRRGFTGSTVRRIMETVAHMQDEPDDE